MHVSTVVVWSNMVSSWGMVNSWGNMVVSSWCVVDNSWGMVHVRLDMLHLVMVDLHWMLHLCLSMYIKN
jgi:hypothetical protein